MWSCIFEEFGIVVVGIEAVVGIGEEKCVVVAVAVATKEKEK